MRATIEGTRRFVEAQPAQSKANFRQTVDGLWVSSIGLGTYLGESDDATDQAYREALAAAVHLGCNVIDTAVNYRFQRSERAIGAWLKDALASGILHRDEVIIATKGGFVPYDTELPAEPRKWVYNEFIATELAHANDFCSNYGHCMAPGYLDQMITWSLRNLGIETIDIYYLHNPETQRLSLSRETFRSRMLDAFETLELAVENGRIASYGTATWSAYRAMTDAPDYLSLTEIVGLATEVAGQNHHLRYVQLPYNVFMTEAFAMENQQVSEAFMSAIAAAEELGLSVMVSAPLMQGRLAHPIMPQLEDMVPGLESAAQRSIQFVRSSPGVTTALVGMKNADHVHENLALIGIEPADGELIRGLFNRRD